MRLPFRGVAVWRGSNRCASVKTLLEESLARDAFESGNVSDDGQFVIARRDHIARIKRNRRATKIQNRAANDDVAVISRIESIGPVLLNFAAQRKRERFGEARL